MLQGHILCTEHKVVVVVVVCPHTTALLPTWQSPLFCNWESPNFAGQRKKLLQAPLIDLGRDFAKHLMWARQGSCANGMCLWHQHPGQFNPI